MRFSTGIMNIICLPENLIEELFAEETDNHEVYNQPGENISWFLIIRIQRKRTLNFLKADI